MDSQNDGKDSVPATPVSLDLERDVEHSESETTTPPLLPANIDLESDGTGRCHIQMEMFAYLHKMFTST